MGAEGLIGPDEIDWNDFAPSLATEGETCGPVWLSGLKFDAPAGCGPLPLAPAGPYSGAACVAVIGWKDGAPRIGAVPDALPDIVGLVVSELPPTPSFAAGRMAVAVHAGRTFAPIICGNCFPITVPKDAAAAAATTGAMGGNPSFGGGGRYSTGMLALEAIISCGSGGGKSL